MKRAFALCQAVTLLVFLMVGCRTIAQEAPAPRPEEDPAGTTDRILWCMAINLFEAYEEVDQPFFNPGDVSGQDTFEGFLTYLEGLDTVVTFDRDTVTPVEDGFSVELEAPLDAWGSRLTAWFVMSDPETVDYTILVVSPGSNRVRNMAGPEDIRRPDRIVDDQYLFYRNGGI